MDSTGLSLCHFCWGTTSFHDFAFGSRWLPFDRLMNELRTMRARLHDIVGDVNLASGRIRTDYSRDLDSGFSLTPF